MRTRLGIAAACVLGFAADAAAQAPLSPFAGTPFGMAPQVMPNFYNPQSQPLSPYLNLLRGGNPGVNYFYGVRPGTIGGAGSFGGSAMLAQGGARGPLFPQFAQSPDPVELPGPGEGYVLPPAGHPVVFNNTLGYFPSPFGGRGAPRAGQGGPGGAGGGAGGGRTGTRGGR